VYEHQTFETVMERMLARVPDDVDKRQGSIIYDALAPAAVELVQMYRELDINRNLSFADTSSGEYLGRRTSEYGVTREPATIAKRKGVFFGRENSPLDVPIGSRFSLDDQNYKVIERMTQGQFILECESPGIVGNQQFGPLIPIDHIDGLVRAELADVLTPGEDEESDESLRKRYLTAINEQPFGGNIADYKRKINGIPGVGGTKVFPVWQGGGTVKCTIIASDYGQPSTELIDEIQAAIDPVLFSGLGIGLAPIGHRVTIAGVGPVEVDISTTLTLDIGVTIGQIQGDIEQVIADYLFDLRKNWESDEQLIVRISQIESKILNVTGVVDIVDTTINGTASNLTLSIESIPVLGVIALG